MSVHYEGNGVTLHHGDCIEVVASLPDNSVDSIVTDPPYGLGFMGKAWDDLPPGEDWAAECLRVLKPGGHLLAFGGTRTWHRLACAVEDAGFEVRDSLAWLYGSGFPKSHDVSKGIDRMAGAERPRTKIQYTDKGANSWKVEQGGQANHWIADAKARGEKTVLVANDEPITDAAREWAGWGTALKPAFEPVVVARKPLIGTVAANVTTHGTGALNIDASRVQMSDDDPRRAWQRDYGNRDYGPAGNDIYSPMTSKTSAGSPLGRWPANVILDSEMAAALDEQSGTLKAPRSNGRSGVKGVYALGAGATEQVPGRADDGGASRFFTVVEDVPCTVHGIRRCTICVQPELPARFLYQAKAPKRERPVVDGVAHPTVKPLALMRWLVRLVTPPGGTVLEPFAGSGTTVEACLLEGFRCVAIEKGDEYLPLILERIRRQTEPPELAEIVRTVDPGAAILEQVHGQLDIFGEATA